MENNVENLIPEEQLLKITEAITQALGKLIEAVQIMTSAACDTLNSIDWEQLERVIDEAKENIIQGENSNDTGRNTLSGHDTDKPED